LKSLFEQKEVEVQGMRPAGMWISFPLPCIKRVRDVSAAVIQQKKYT